MTDTAPQGIVVVDGRASRSHRRMVFVACLPSLGSFRITIEMSRNLGEDTPVDMQNFW
jgi:hypothetical protein